MVLWLFFWASCSGVPPHLSTGLSAAPCLIKSSTTWLCPSAAARCKGVLPVVPFGTRGFYIEPIAKEDRKKFDPRGHEGVVVAPRSRRRVEAGVSCA